MTEKRIRKLTVKNTVRVIKFRSKTEERYANELELLKKAKKLKSWEYEPITLKIGVSRTYTPDFLIHYSKIVEIVEVKGYPIIKERGGRAYAAEGIQRTFGIFKFMVAAYQYTCCESFYDYGFSEDIFPVTKSILWRLVEEKNKQWKTIYAIHNGEKIKQTLIPQIPLIQNTFRKRE